MTAKRPRALARLPLIAIALALGSSPTAAYGGSFLVLDLGGDGLVLTDQHYAVEFDVDGDGSMERITWTAETQDEALLWLDNNGDGRADGTELVGSCLLTPRGLATGNAFEVLARHDLPVHGGNGDGRLSEDETVWQSLRLWIDRDHNGLPSRKETSGPRELGIVEIGLHYRPYYRVGGGLNEEIAWSPVRMRIDGDRKGEGRIRESRLIEVHFQLVRDRESRGDE